MNDLGRREGATCMWSVGGGAFAEGREGSGRGGEGGHAGFGDIEDIESTASTGLDLRACGFVVRGFVAVFDVLLMMVSDIILDARDDA